MEPFCFLEMIGKVNNLNNTLPSTLKKHFPDAWTEQKRSNTVVHAIGLSRPKPNTTTQNVHIQIKLRTQNNVQVMSTQTMQKCQ